MYPYIITLVQYLVIMINQLIYFHHYFWKYSITVCLMIILSIKEQNYRLINFNNPYILS